MKFVERIKTKREIKNRIQRYLTERRKLENHISKTKQLECMTELEKQSTIKMLNEVIDMTNQQIANAVKELEEV